MTNLIKHSWICLAHVATFPLSFELIWPIYTEHHQQHQTLQRTFIAINGCVYIYIRKYAHAHTYHNTSLYGDIPDNAPAMRVVVDSPKCAWGTHWECAKPFEMGDAMCTAPDVEFHTLDCVQKMCRKHQLTTFPACMHVYIFLWQILHTELVISMTVYIIINFLL